MTRPGALLVCVTVVLGLLLAGCSGGVQGTGDANYAEDNAVQTVPPGERGDPVEISGTSLQGEPVDLADYRGDVVVLNFWGSWCNPCRDEAPVLKTASEELDAVFLGAQLRADSTAASIAFEEEFGITYPTIADGGSSALALGRWAPRAAPSTAVLDREGRVAALISGVVPSVITLEELVEEAGADG
ncbi:TlpA family protein disulfide reductase [Nocardioides litoris]|uniref:TlpA family protein disulfide reductase n=1 Tax=Nocardioides litoris TaxID=1926648 RepID=UPI00111EAD75|nr:TlpA disulfide reductase family protein [Nocardioides litoris]